MPFFFTEEEYKRLSEALADEGTYNAVAFKYSADYYDPSQPTEEEDAKREHGENLSQVYDYEERDALLWFLPGVTEYFQIGVMSKGCWSFDVIVLGPTELTTRYLFMHYFIRP